MRSLTTGQIALLSALIAAAVGIQLAPRPIPNVETTSLFTFLVGILFGSIIGGSFGGLVMLVNGFLSPWGFGGLNIPFQMAGMAIVGITGGFYKRYTVEVSPARVSVEVTILGASLTLLYDLITNVGVAVPFMPKGSWHIALAASFSLGAPFSLVHVASNSFLFGSGFIPLVKALKRVPGGEVLWSKRELLSSQC